MGEHAKSLGSGDPHDELMDGLQGHSDRSYDSVDAHAHGEKGESPEVDAVRPRKGRVLGTVKEPGTIQTDQHHVFPQEHAPWFTERGVDVHDFTIDVSLPEHGAQHGGGDWRLARDRWNRDWNNEIMRLLNAAERNKQAVQGPTVKLSPAEILKIGQRLMARRGLGGLQFHRYQVSGRPV